MRPWLPHNRVAVTELCVKAALGEENAAEDSQNTTVTQKCDYLEIPPPAVLDAIAKNNHGVEVSVSILHEQQRTLPPNPNINPSSSSSANFLKFGVSRSRHLNDGSLEITEVVSEEVPLVVGGQLPAPLLPTAVTSEYDCQSQGGGEVQLGLSNLAFYPTVVPCYSLSNCRLPSYMTGKSFFDHGENSSSAKGTKGVPPSGQSSSSHSAATPIPPLSLRSVRTIQQYAIPFLLQHSSAALAAMKTTTTTGAATDGSLVQNSSRVIEDREAVGTGNGVLDHLSFSALSASNENRKDAENNGLLPSPCVLPTPTSDHKDSQSDEGQNKLHSTALAVVGTPGSGKTTAMAVSLSALLLQKIADMTQTFRSAHGHSSTVENDQCVGASTNNPNSKTSASHLSSTHKTVGELVTSDGPLAIVFVSSREAELQYASVLEQTLGDVLSAPLLPTGLLSSAAPHTHGTDSHSIAHRYGAVKPAASKRERSTSRDRRDRDRDSYEDSHRRGRGRDRSRSRSRSRERRDRSRDRGHHNSATSTAPRVVAKNINSNRNSLVIIQNVFSLEKDLFLPHRLVAPTPYFPSSGPAGGGQATNPNARNNGPQSYHSPTHQTGGPRHAGGPRYPSGGGNVSYNTLPAAFTTATTRALLFLIFDPVDVFLCPPVLNTFPTPFWNWLRALGGLTANVVSKDDKNVATSSAHSSGNSNAVETIPRVQIWLNHNCSAPSSSRTLALQTAGGGGGRPTPSSAKTANLHTFLHSVLKRDMLLNVRKTNTGAWGSINHRVVSVPSSDALVPSVFDAILRFICTSVTVTQTIITTTPASTAAKTVAATSTNNRDQQKQAPPQTAATLRLGAAPPLASQSSASTAAPSTAQQPPSKTKTIQQTSKISKAWHKNALIFVANKTDATMMRQILTKLTENYENPNIVATYAKRVPVTAGGEAGQQQTKLEMHTVAITGDEVRAFFSNNVQFLTEWHLKSQTIPPTVNNVSFIINLNYASANAHTQFYNKDSGINSNTNINRYHHGSSGPAAAPPLPFVPQPATTGSSDVALFSAPSLLVPTQSVPAPATNVASPQSTSVVRLPLPHDVSPSAYEEMSNDLNTLSYLFASRSKLANNALTTFVVGLTRENQSALGSAFAHFLLETNQASANYLSS